MKPLFLLALLMAGTAWADEYIHDDIGNKMKVGGPSEPSSGAITLSPEAIEKLRPKLSDIRYLNLDLIAIVQDRICPSGWKESNYFVLKKSTTPYIRTEDWRFYGEKIEGLTEIETCPDNGLIRVKP